MRVSPCKRADTAPGSPAASGTCLGLDASVSLFFFKLLLECSCFTMSFLPSSKVTQLSVYVCPLFCIFPPRSGHHGALSRVPCLHSRFSSATCLRGLSDPHLSSGLSGGRRKKAPCQLLREASDKQPHLKSVDESGEKERKKESFFFF